ncbi:2,3-diaminopropionate biosynthesis protein SbnA [Micromonospora sp. DT229]|uniref:2,3-diaminopropionate biosynthesis protein SbnA n=1 Tax=Micromonospora sp. DT229 TaxID=3393430 RepID=UPI003CE711D7
MTGNNPADRLDLIDDHRLRTPVARLAHDRINLYAKLEYSNRSGSTKDRSAYWILRRAVERGELGPHSTVVESSSGNFAISLASYCRALGVPFVPVIDENVNPPTEGFLRRLCAHVEKVGDLDETGGYLATRLARVQHLRAELDDVYWPDQYSNPDAADAHFRFTAEEVRATFGRLDYLFVGVGTGATVAGLSTRLKQVYPHLRVIAVDAEGSAIFGGPPRRRHIPGLGSSLIPPLLTDALIDEVLIVPEVEAVAGCHRLLHRHGLYAGGSTGSVYFAIERYFDDYVGPAPTVLFLCADRGTAYAETVYEPAWIVATFGPDAVPDDSSRPLLRRSA